MYELAPSCKISRIFYSTKCILDNEAKTYLKATPLRYYRLGKKNNKNKDNRSFSY